MTTEEKAEFWQQSALDLTAGRLLLGLDFRVIVEDSEDVLFWQLVISQSIQGKKYDFVSGSQSPSGNLMHGKTHCLNYFGSLSPHLLAAVDSDFDYLRDNLSLSATNYVLQTYTYSIENHYSHSSTLQKQWQIISDSTFEFKTFLQKLSLILYRPLIHLLMSIEKNDCLLTPSMLRNALMGFQKKLSDLENNGEALLHETQNRLEVLLPSSYSDQEIKLQFQRYQAKGLTPETAYLYWRGHDIKDYLVQIGQLLAHHKFDFISAVYIPSLDRHPRSYWQYQRIKEDLESILA